ncbi:helix-turn-helix transcriptional regulator [Paraburkholderia fungorum]|uniref:helix-turn-helix domain-containing protein n=1 Tax=Paraburkholderia fungorum TaxID=134537 RepID=UPI0038B7D647
MKLPIALVRIKLDYLPNFILKIEKYSPIFFEAIPRDSMSRFSVALRQLRAELELAQGEFAALLGFRQAYISALECGTKLPKDDELVRKIVEVLDLSPAHETMLRQADRTRRARSNQQSAP